MKDRSTRKILSFLLAIMLIVQVFGQMTSVLAVETNAETTAINPKKLVNVITEINLMDGSNNTPKMVDGVYQLVQNSPYKYEVKFDLTAYDGNLNDGDYFTFNITEPITVKDETFALVDPKTSITIGDVAVVSKGDNLGGTATVTLKNLLTYLEVTGGSQVQDVLGTFYVQFMVKELTDESTLTYDTEELKAGVEHKIKVIERTDSDYTSAIDTENFDKIHGVLQETPWTSDILAAAGFEGSGDYQHPFTIRVNTRQASYDTIIVHDYINMEQYPVRFIPETLTVKSVYPDTHLNLQGSKTLEEGVDYLVRFNESYTDFEVEILNASTRIADNGKPSAYSIGYSTTAPGNGLYIGNFVEMTADGEVLTSKTTNQITTVYA